MMLRSADLSDLKVIDSIRRNAILAIESELLTERDRHEWAHRRLKDFFRARVVSGDALVAELDGQVVGWGSVSGNSVTGLYVQPAFSSKGIGRTIMSSLESRIAADGHAEAKLDSSSNAVGFYRGLGYVPVGRTKRGGGSMTMGLASWAPTDGRFDEIRTRALWSSPSLEGRGANGRPWWMASCSSGLKCDVEELGR